MLVNTPVYETNPKFIKLCDPSYSGKIYIELRFGNHDFYHKDGLYHLKDGWRSQNSRATEAVYVFTVKQFKAKYDNFYTAIQAMPFATLQQAKLAIEDLLKIISKD